MKYHLTTPLHQEDINQLNAGDIIYISGTILTARDEAHARILEYAKTGKSLPFNLENAVIYHCGPLIQQKNDKWEVIALGPTTSDRMSKMTPELLEHFNVKALIGKGGMNNIDNAFKNTCIYLAYTGGCAAIAARSITNVKNCYWDDLGMPEAVWELEADTFGPLIIGIDTKGNNLFKTVKDKAKKVLLNQ